MGEYRRKTYERKDWRKSGWARAAETGLYAASRLHPVASAAYDGVGAVTGFNTEKRCFDIATTTTAGSFGAAGTFQFNLTASIAQGDDGDQCSGNSIRATDCMLKYRLINNISAIGATTCRVILFSDRENQGAVPVIADILENAASADLTIEPLNRSNFGRFQIWSDKLHDLSAQSTITSSDQVRNEELTYGQDKLGENHHILWDDTNAHNTGTMRQGHFFFWAIYNNTDVGATGTPSVIVNANPPYCALYFRIRFVDN